MDKGDDLVVSTLKSVVQFLENNIVNIPDGEYPIAQEYLNGFSPGEIREGVKALTAFYHRMFQSIIQNPASYIDPVKPGTDPDKITYEAGYTYARYPSYILYGLGVVGTLAKDTPLTLSIDGKALNDFLKIFRMKNIKNYFLFLEGLGFSFEDVDFDTKAFSLAKADPFRVSYPDHPELLLGMKALAQASEQCKNNRGKDAVYRIFSRCEYRALADTHLTKAPLVIEDCLRSAPEDARDFLYKLHTFLMDNGCKCEGRNYPIDIKFTYTRQTTKAVVTSIQLIPENAYVKCNPKFMDRYSHLLAGAPAGAKEAMTSGIDCAKVTDPKACNPKCKGLPFTMDGKAYHKCIGANFYLPLHTSQEKSFILDLLKGELACV